MSVLIGALVLVGINFFGQYIGLTVPINIWTIFLIGILRIPGFILILLIILL